MIRQYKLAELYIPIISLKKNAFLPKVAFLRLNDIEFKVGRKMHGDAVGRMSSKFCPNVICTTMALTTLFGTEQHGYPL